MIGRQLEHGEARRLLMFDEASDRLFSDFADVFYAFCYLFDAIFFNHGAACDVQSVTGMPSTCRIPYP